MKAEDIELEHFYLTSLYRINKDELEYLKKLEHNKNLMLHFDTLTVYVGRKNAFFIKINQEFIGFLVIANDPYLCKGENTKELFLIIDEEHQRLGLGTLVIKEISDYLLELEEVDNVVISPFNKNATFLAQKAGFENYDGFKLIRSKRKRSR